MENKETITALPCLQELFHISTLLRAALADRTDSSGLYQAQRRLLIHIDRKPGASQTELAESLNISPAAVTVALKKLEAAGYISRRRCDEGDSRVRATQLTDKGHATIDETIEIFATLEDTLFQGFTYEERLSFISALHRIADNLIEERKV